MEPSERVWYRQNGKTVCSYAQSSLNDQRKTAHFYHLRGVVISDCNRKWICTLQVSQMDNGGTDVTQPEHIRTLTDKGLEEKLHSKINTRRGKLRRLTAKSNEIELLTEHACNLNNIETKHFKIYKWLFVESNGSIVLLQKIHGEGGVVD